jgi:hypothetical protein
MTIVNQPIGGTEQSQIVSVSINGVSIGIFNSLTGGGSTATVPQARSGGQLNQQSYRVRPKYGAIKVSRILNLATDWELIRSLKPQAGLAPASVTVQPVDADLNAYGESQTATGMFTGVDDINVNVDSEAVQNFTLNFTVDAWQ